MSIDTLEPGLATDHDAPDEPAPAVVRPAPVAVRPAPAAVRPAPVVVRPALLAGEEREAPDPWIYRGTD